MRWLRQRHPSVWVLLAVLTVHSRGRSDKRLEMQTIQDQLNSDEFHITIITTAALPWMTGTAINPLLRAAHLAKAGKRVTLCVPWLHPLEQALVFPGGLRFHSPQEQQAHVRRWLQERAGVRANFEIVFYPARYDQERGSILPLGDITQFIAAEERDIAVLEEPEHLTWYHNGPNWRHRFKLVVGVVHTNYLYYASTWANGGPFLAQTLKQVNIWVCRAYCDKVIKLSDTIQPLPRAVVCNVHGVRSDFLDIGRRAGLPFNRFKKGAYFLGKVLWAKGHRLLIDYLSLERAREMGLADELKLTHVDIYGKGEDLEEVKASVAQAQLDVSFFPATDHAGPALREYKVFINPSESEVLSTTTAEALAMGKFVVIRRHPSNDFFMQFRNTLAYETPAQFLQMLAHALEATPTPLSAQERRALSWEGATDRFLLAVRNCSAQEMLPSLADHTARWVHTGIQKGGYLGDALRFMSGGGPISRQSWLTQERFRDAKLTEIVEHSVALQPPVTTPS